MTFFSRAVLLFVCGIVQIFFAAHLLFDWNILDLPSDLMFIPGILVLLTWAILSLDYHFGNKDLWYQTHYWSDYETSPKTDLGCNITNQFTMFSV